MNRHRLAVAIALLALSAASAPLFAGGPYQYHAVTPCRVADTRACSANNTTPYCGTGPGFGLVSFTFQGVCGVPSGATAVTLNATIVQATAAGFLKLFPAGTTEPLVSTLNFVAGEPALANGAIVPLSALSVSQTTDLTARIAVGPGTAYLVLDVTGYFQ